MSYIFCRKFTVAYSEFHQMMTILYHICNMGARWKAYKILIFFLFFPYLVAVIFIGYWLLKTRRCSKNWQKSSQIIFLQKAARKGGFFSLLYNFRLSLTLPLPPCPPGSSTTYQFHLQTPLH